MSANGSLQTDCRSEVRPDNIPYSQKEVSITASAVSMTVGIFCNGLALCMLAKSYNHIRVKSKASFLLIARSLMFTDMMGHLTTGSMVLFVYCSHKKWEKFDHHNILCNIFGACMVFFGLSPLFHGSLMAVERCIGVIKPIFHSTIMESHHMKRLLIFAWLLAFLVAMLPVMLKRPYTVQSSRSWCFFHMGGTDDWLNLLVPLLFSVLGLLALLVSIVCNTLTSCALLHSVLCRKHRTIGTSYHIEMICQLLAIMLVSCVCWSPLLIHIIVLSARENTDPASFNLLLVVRIATWNQILDPWVYILLRKAVLNKIFTLFHHLRGPRLRILRQWPSSMFRSSRESSKSGATAPSHCMPTLPPPVPTIKSIT